MSVSVALSPTPTTSTFSTPFFAFESSVILLSQPLLSNSKRSGEDCKEEGPGQLKCVVRHRAKPQSKSRTRSAAVKSAAGPQCKGICGMRAIAAKNTKIALATATSSQSQTVREGADSPAA